MSFLYFLEDLRNPVLDAFFSVVTHIGTETLLLAVAIIIFWCIGKEDGYYFMTVGFVGTGINQFLKLYCRIPRPWVRDPNFTIVESARAGADGYSFPSGHTQSAAGTLGCPARITKKTWLRVLCIVGILLTGLSRMYLGVHTPADVGVSLVVGAVLVLGLYPIFQKGRQKPAYIYAALAVVAVLSTLFILYIELNSWPADIDEHNLSSGVKNGYLLLGCSWGMLLSYHLERRFIHFDTAAPLWAQVLKTALGLGLVLALKSGLKPVLIAVFGGHMFYNAVRYFIIVLFAALVWPLTFKWFAAGFPLKKKAKPSAE